MVPNHTLFSYDTDCLLFIHTQVSERHDTISRLKAELKSVEEKYREAQSTLSQRGDAIQRIQQEAKLHGNKVRN